MVVPDFFEVDNTSSQAKTITVDGTNQYHSIHVGTDIDWVKFTLDATRDVEIRTKGTSGDTEMWLYGPDSSTTLVEYNDNASSTNYFSRIVRTGTNALRTGMYYVKVGEKGSNASIESYTIRVLADDSYENNDTKAITDPRPMMVLNSPNLGPIMALRTISNLAMVDTGDWYRFYIRATGTSSDFVRASFTHSEGNLNLHVYRSNGTLFRSSAGTVDNETVSLSGAAAGWYYANVVGASGASNRYSLTIDPPGQAPAQTVWLDFEGGSSSRGWTHAISVPRMDATKFGLSASQRTELIGKTVTKVVEDYITSGSISTPTTPLNLPITFTLQRPTSGSYSRVFIGGSSIVGWAGTSDDIDTGNADLNSEARVYTDTIATIAGGPTSGNLEQAAQAIANTISHELGHTLGLQHLRATELHLMQYGGLNPSFTDNERFGSGSLYHTSGTQNDVTLLQTNLRTVSTATARVAGARSGAFSARAVPESAPAPRAVDAVLTLAMAEPNAATARSMAPLPRAVDRFLAFDRPAASEVDPSPLAEQRAVLLAEEFLSEAGKGGWVLPIGREVQVS